MFRRLCALLLAILAVTAASAEDLFPMDVYQDNPEVYQIEDAGDQLVSISTIVEPEYLMFTHPYESDSYFSVMQNRLLVFTGGDYAGIPVFFTAIDYEGTKALNINAVSLILEGKTYTFTDFDSQSSVQTDGTLRQAITISYGKNSAELFTILGLNSMNAIMDDPQSPQLPDVTVILHGEDEEVTVDVPDGFLYDYASLFTPLLINTDVVGRIGYNPGTPCEVSE
ncbi:MAG: hypothetical protein IJ083_05400 [Clostridia bacterium]|nr:hypothetical protein [Clostridia bacterium]